MVYEKMSLGQRAIETYLFANTIRVLQSGFLLNSEAQNLIPIFLCLLVPNLGKK